MAQVHLICYVLRLGMGTLVARWVACGGTFLFSLAACNLVTGAGDLSVADDGSSSGAGGNGSGGQGTGAGVSNNDLLPTDAASITAIEMYQSVRRPLMEGGAAASSTVPLVAERDAMMRIHYTASARVEVTVLINIGDADPIVVPASLNGTSDVATLTSTINVPIPGEILQTGVGYRVELLEARDNTSGTNAGAVYPASGQEMMPLVSAGGPLKLVLVPITYGADGSDRLPDTSMAHIEEYRELFLSYYPVPDVAITVSGPIQWNSTVSAGGQGWGTLLDALRDHRQSQGAPSDEHYYGIFNPASSFSNYCQGGCVTGLSFLASSPGDEMGRVGIGVGFTGASAGTGAHEIGHQHGREHAPCQVGDGDPQFPHSGGTIGEWGLDLRSGQLVQPATADFMGYCDPTWVSDYTYTALFNRISAVNGASWHYDPNDLDQSYERIRIDEEGATWTKPIDLHLPPSGKPASVTLEDGGRHEVVAGRFYPYSHLPGGVLLFPKQPRSVTSASFDIEGLTRLVVRHAVEMQTDPPGD